MACSVDIVIPVYNEEHSLPRCVATLIPFCRSHLGDYDWRVVIADNGSIDGTLRVAEELVSENADYLRVVHLDEKGRGRALKRTWSESDADIRTYMDVDLSTDLVHLPELVDAVRDGSPVATGSRLRRGARTTRSAKREVISRIYNLIIRAVFWSSFSDAQCGFKAVDRRTAETLVPLVQDDNWFFDTELLILAERNGFGIADIPVSWEEDPDTRVKVISTALEDLKGLARLRFGGVPRVRTE
jgi:glycosyltransferase involved in cell wall biosynthesis